MPLVVTASPKGGVGKTTVTATLAIALRALGWEVMAVDLDIQNSLRLHLGIPPEEPDGWARRVLQRQHWEQAVLQNRQEIRVLPFGAVPEEASAALEAALGQPTNPFFRELAHYATRADTIVLLDTPPGPSVYSRGAAKVADLRIVVLLADAASYAVTPSLNAVPGRGQRQQSAEHAPPTVYIANQFDNGKRLSRDVHAAMRHLLGPRLVATVQRDEAVAEAIACQQSVLLYDRNSRAAHDLLRLGVWVDDYFEKQGQRRPEPGMVG